ncbi:MAG: dynamin family protein [Desulfosarcinaceae bacterium]
MEFLLDPQTAEALGRLRERLTIAVTAYGLDSPEKLAAWQYMLDAKLLPRLSPDFPATAASCGGGSSGKSTLFNSLAGAPFSPTGGRAGLNRRVLVGLHPEQARKQGFLQALFQPFDSEPEELALGEGAALTETGPPLYALSEHLPVHLALVDTPDFDTGAQGVYANRELARQSLETADVLIYIFTNANYNNRDNTDFLAQMLTAIGVRPAILVYRVYPSFGAEEVAEHAATVAANLYGGDAEQHLLGVYRVDEDNAVAAGKVAVQPQPARPQDVALDQLLAGIDPRQLRQELFTTILADVIAQAKTWQGSLNKARASITAYGGALGALQGQAVQTALSHFPLDPVLRRFAIIWLESDPGYIKAMRRTGRALEMPFNAVVKTVRWLSGRSKDAAHNKPPPPEWHTELDEDLLTAANRLYQGVTSDILEINLADSDPLAEALKAQLADFRNSGALSPEVCRITSDAGRPDSVTACLAVPAGLAKAQQRVRRLEWRKTLERILAAKEEILGFTAQMDRDLRQLADTRRRQMGWGDQLKQTFSAALNVLPATAAVTYILATGDPVGAVGIKVKLAGIFGLHDLYALVAIPATAGLQKADRKQLEEMLGPVAQSWLLHKLEAVNTLFEKEVTGELKARAEEAAQEAKALIDGIQSQLATLSRLD